VDVRSKLLSLAVPAMLVAAPGSLTAPATVPAVDAASSTSGSAPGAATAAAHAVRFALRTMGTTATVTIVSADSAAMAPFAGVAHGALRRVDSLMSNWTTTSEVARINRVAGAGPTHVHPEVARVLGAALEVGRATGGAMDVTVEPLVRAWGFLGGTPHVPSDAEARAAAARVGLSRVRFDAASGTVRFTRPDVRVDLGSIAKGYGVDVAAESLRAHGVSNALVDLSGNMMPIGAPAGAPDWRIGIRDPRDRIPYLGHLALHGQAIATSGIYEQFVAANGRTYGHIMDPRRGRPAEGLISVTVLAPSAMLADAWDTGLFVLGAAKAKRIARSRDELDVVLVEPGPGGVDVVWVERSLAGRFVLEPAAKELVRLSYY
jgi:thiamine biosynthesis lipoprotein